MYNFKKKLVSITSAASLVVGMFNIPGTSVVSYAEEAKKPIVSSKSAGWTFGIYMCGQNLEEEMGCSTNDLIEILKADVPKGFSKDNNFIVETGGCWGWNFKEVYGTYLKEEKKLTDEEIAQVIPDEIDYTKLSLYKINFEHEYKAVDGTTKTIPALEFVKDIGEYDTSVRDEYYSYFEEGKIKSLNDAKKLKKKLKEKYNKDDNDVKEETSEEDAKKYANMGDSKYLKMFLDELDENYPAEHMAIDLWNHGGGITDGVCFDEYTDDGISLKELKEVLKSRSEEGRGKLDLLGYDACLMSNYETWINISPYVKTGVGALTSEPADGWYYTPFVEKLGANYNSDKYTSAELSKDIVEAFEEYYKKDGVLSELMASGDYIEGRDKLGHYKELEEVEHEHGEEDGPYDAKLCAVDLEDIALTSIKFGELSRNLLDAFQDKEGIKNIFDQTVDKGAIESFYGYEFSGIDSFLDAVSDIAPGRVEILSESDNMLDVHAADSYKKATTIATELKEAINNSIIANYKGWEESDFYNSGAMSIYTPFLYPSINPMFSTASFNYEEYPEYAVSPDYARLMYLVAGNIKQLTMDEVDMTPNYQFDLDSDKLSIEYSEDAMFFIDEMSAFKLLNKNNKRYIISSSYTDPFIGESKLEVDLNGKYFTFNGSPVDVLYSEYDIYDENFEPTGEKYKEISVDGELNGKIGTFYFLGAAEQETTFSYFMDLTDIYENEDLTEEEKKRIISRARKKNRDELVEDGNISEEDDLYDEFGIMYAHQLNEGDKIELYTATISEGTSYNDMLSDYSLNGITGPKGYKFIENKLTDIYTVSEKDLVDGFRYDEETDTPIPTKIYAPKLDVANADDKDVDVFIGSLRYSEIDSETLEPLAIETESKEFNIGKLKGFAKAKISVVVDEYELTGREIKPEIKFEGTDIKFEEGKDYEVVYENNLGLGKGKVIVKGLGNYNLISDKTAEFNIIEAKKIVAKNGEIKTVYVVVKAPKQVRVKKIKNTRKKSFKIKWKKIKGANGYEVKYALNKKFTKGKVLKNVSSKKTSLKIFKLKKKKTYYVKVRAYTLDTNGKRIYGNWSNIRKVKIKR